MEKLINQMTKTLTAQAEEDSSDIFVHCTKLDHFLLRLNHPWSATSQDDDDAKPTQRRFTQMSQQT